MANQDNPLKGAIFERAVKSLLEKNGLSLVRPFSLEIGVGKNKKQHRFDIGSENPRTIVECKAHTWTQSGNAPSAKMSVWNEAMYYFFIAPADYSKYLYVLKSSNKGISLAEYYIQRYQHLIPLGVEIWEYNPTSNHAECKYPQAGMTL